MSALPETKTSDQDPDTEAPDQDPDTEAPDQDPDTDAPDQDPDTEAPDQDPDTEAFDQDQWPCRCAEVAEPAPGRLLLRVALREGEAICDVFTEERSDRVEVEVLACAAAAGTTAALVEIEVYLRAALSGRPVIDLSAGVAVTVPGLIGRGPLPVCGDPRQSPHDERHDPASPVGDHLV